MTATKDKPKGDGAQDRDSSYYGSPEFINKVRADMERKRLQPWLDKPIPWSARDIAKSIAEFDGGEFKFDPYNYPRHERRDRWFNVMAEVFRTSDWHEILALSGTGHIEAYRREDARRRKAEGKPARVIIEPREIGWIAAKETKPRAWLYKPHYQRGFMSSTVAPGGIGKTSLGLVESLAMVTRKDVLGIMPSEPEALNVWYWNGEDPQEEMERRWAALLKYYGIKSGDLKGRFFMDSGRDLKIKIAKIGKEGDIRIAVPVVDAMIEAIKSRQIDVLHIDPFVSSHIVPENANEAMQQVAEQWAHIANECDCCIVLWHHSRKTGGKETTFEDGRGASAVGDAARGRRVLNKMTEAEAKNAGIEPGARGRYFWASHEGSSMVPPAETREWYKLESVNLMNDEDGLDGDEIGVVTAWDYTAAGGVDAAPEEQAAIIEAIQAGGPWRMDVQAKNWIGHAFAGVLKLDPKKDRAKIKATVADWIASEILEEYKNRHPDRPDRPVAYVRLSADAEFDDI